MARLPRLAVPEHAHLVLLLGHRGQRVFTSDGDRSAFLSAVHSACSVESVALHAYAVLPERVWLLCRPPSALSLSRAIQALGRGFSAAYNRRHGRSGNLWDGRYRSTVVEDGPALLEAMVFVDQALVRTGLSADALSTAWSSARQHAGEKPECPLTDAPAYWALGNTPFDRCTAYRALLADPQPEGRVRQLEAATQRGWAVGSASFLESLRQHVARPVTPRPRGRPRKVRAQP